MVLIVILTAISLRFRISRWRRLYDEILLTTYSAYRKHFYKKSLHRGAHNCAGCAARRR